MKDVEIAYFIDAEEPSIEVIEEAQKKIDNAMALWRKFESKKVVEKLKKSAKTPELLKTLLVEKNIICFSWERFITSADYFPDFCETLRFYSQNDECVCGIVVSTNLTAEDGRSSGLIDEDDIAREDTGEFLELTGVLQNESNESKVEEVFDYLETFLLNSDNVDFRIKEYNN